MDFSGLAERVELLNSKIKLIIEKISSSQNPSTFVDYLTLNEKISTKSGKIGEYERDFFLKAYEHMIENAEILTSLTPCWSAH